MLKIIFLSVLCFISINSYASDTATGKITRIGGQMTGAGSIYFGIETEPENRPECSTHGIYYYVFDPTTEKGKSMFTLLLTAKSLGHKISVHGTGECILGQPMEEISFWILRDEV